LPEGMTIGQLARAAEVNVETVRYYQRVGLLPVPPRPQGGYRCYSDADLSRLRFIRRAKTTGFPLKDIQVLLQLDEKNCADVRELAEHKLANIRKRIADLESMATSLSTMILQCESSKQPACPIIDAFSHK